MDVYNNETAGRRLPLVLITVGWVPILLGVAWLLSLFFR